MTKVLKVIHLPNQYDKESFEEGCRLLLELVAERELREATK